MQISQGANELKGAWKHIKSAPGLFRYFSITEISDFYKCLLNSFNCMHTWLLNTLKVQWRQSNIKMLLNK